MSDTTPPDNSAQDSQAASTPPAAPAQPAAAPAAAPPAGVPAQPSKTMSVLALVFGILALVGAFIPFVGFFSFAFAVAAIVLGIIVLVKKKPSKGMGLTGLILGAVSIITSIIMSIVFFGLLALLGAASTEIDTLPTETATTEEYAELEIPAGFTDFGTGVAFQFLDSSCELYDSCKRVELYAYTDCREGVELVANLLDPTETVLGETWEYAGVMFAGDYATVELEVYDTAATDVQITDITCYTE